MESTAENISNTALNNELTVLLVDDDDLDSTSVKRMLKKLDPPPKLIRVTNGIQALELLNSQAQIDPPYLILLDINMPKMNGLEFLEEVRKDIHLQNAVIFVLTTSAADKDKLSAYNSHIAGYIVKSEAGPELCYLSKMIDLYRKTVTLLH